MQPLQSESLAQLTAALVEAQKGIEGARRTAANSHLGNRYADLAEVWEACRLPLTANGFCVTAALEMSEGDLVLRTTLRHASGEWLASLFPIAADPGKPQQIGSAITYGRRYCLAALVGVCPEDDDGEAAQQGQAPRKAGRRERQQADGRGEVNGAFPAKPASSLSQFLNGLIDDLERESPAGSDDEKNARFWQAVRHTVRLATEARPQLLPTRQRKSKEAWNDLIGLHRRTPGFVEEVLREYVPTLGEPNDEDERRAIRDERSAPAN